MKQKYIYFLLMCFFPSLASAGMSDYKKYYEVDLDAPIPDIKALELEIYRAEEIYRPNYTFNWNIGLVFDSEMSSMITSFGADELRRKAPNEDILYDQIKAMPKEYYPYIGPHLHASKGISEKILNMPGIKETKNQFPKVIAPQLADIEDLEFLSPHLYILLMPQMWPSNQKPLEKVRPRPARKMASGYDADFYARVLKDVPAQGFGGEARNGTPALPDRLRTIHPTKTSPLTGADVTAFAKTLPAIRDFANKNILALIRAGGLLDYWEQKNGTALMLNGMKDMVNPCQRLALKAKWAGLETSLYQAVAPQAFNVKEWAYTCDKAIKAYRTARISTAQLSALQSFKRGMHEAYLQTMDPKWRENQYAIMQTLVEMYTAPKGDVLEALKHETELAKEIRQFGGSIGPIPLSD